MGISNSINDSIFSKNRINKLIKNFNELDKKQVEVVDKIAIQELLNLYGICFKLLEPLISNN